MIIDRKAKTVQFTRRDMLKGGVAAAGTLAAAKILPGVGNSLLHPTPAKASTFIKGCDIGFWPQMVSEGYVWKNSAGKTMNLLDILKDDYGINCIRIRTWVNPASIWCDQAQAIALAQQVNAKGMQVLIDFHYGDTWNSVGKQNPPAAWAGMTYSQMLSALGSYTWHFQSALKAAGVTPTYVQHGNEINSGLCHPIGSISNPSQMTGLLMEGRKMTLEIFPAAKCLIHLAQPQNTAAVYKMLNAYKANGGEWDITAFSSYGTGSEVAGIVSDMKTFASYYGKPVMQVEFGESVSNPSGTESSLKAYIEGVGGFGGLGVFYWEPEVYATFRSGDTSGAWNDVTFEPTAGMNGFLANP